MQCGTEKGPAYHYDRRGSSVQVPELEDQPGLAGNAAPTVDESLFEEMDDLDIEDGNDAAASKEVD